MATYFISDTHLCGHRPEIVELFTRFLADISEQAEALYILGDLFDAWIGDDYCDPGVIPAIEALTHYSSHYPIHIMPGNRDFLLGNSFETQTGCRLLPDEIIIDINGMSTLLMHGDTLCTDDVDYQSMRTKVHDPKWQTHVLSLTIPQRLDIAKQFRLDSDSSKDGKSESIMDVNQQTIETVMSQHKVTCLIHGHTHKPNRHEFSLDNTQHIRHVLADWYKQGSALIANDSGLKVLNLK